MPLHADIRINEHDIAAVKISRLQRLDEGKEIYDYEIRATDGRVARFRHRYDDGAYVCLERGLAALRMYDDPRQWHSARPTIDM